MNRQAPCGRAQALSRTDLAERYLTVAELASEEEAEASHNVAVGNAVLAGIAAADALCCLRLGQRSRSQDHRIAIESLRTVDKALARDLEKLLRLKDIAHYGDRFLGGEQLVTAIRCGQRLVEAAREATRG
jgi:hypothetical protein